GMNAHHTIGIVSSVAKMPDGAPASMLAMRIAGKKAAKYSFAPNTKNISCTEAASAIATTAATNAHGDHGLILKITSRMDPCLSSGALGSKGSRGRAGGEGAGCAAQRILDGFQTKSDVVNLVSSTAWAGR